MPAKKSPNATPRPPARPVHAAVAALALAPVALALIPSGAPVNPNCGTVCGHERWAVKTLSDPAATSVNTTPQEITVSELVGKTAPPNGSETRVPPLETQVYTVHADLLGYKVEGDNDLHIVIRDQTNTGDTMIVEIPNPACHGVCSSIAGDQIKQSRTTFESAFSNAPPSSTYAGLSTPVPIVVTGVPLFDFVHPVKQTGLAKNCIELHPVLSITIPTDRSLAVVRGTANEPTPPKGITYNCMPKSAKQQILD